MGRAGSGGGGHSSGGVHSFGGHSGGGHHVSSRSGSGRAGAGGGRSGHHGGGGFGHPGNPEFRGGWDAPPPPHHGYHRGGWGGPPPRRPFFSVGYLIFWVALIAILAFSVISRTGSSSVKSTIQREKLSTGNAYINDCIIDEIGWFDNITSTEQQLKSFWEETGVQPYIILKSYDSSLTTDDQKENWTTSYYDENFENENIFLFVYFAEQDTDNDVGYMCYANGVQTSSVMDSEAVEIFWNYMDQYWYSDLSTDDMFVTVFDKTAQTIMRVSTTGADVAKTAVIAIAVVILAIISVIFWNKKRQAEKERAAETERILNTPMQDLVKEKEDDLTSKYN